MPNFTPNYVLEKPLQLEYYNIDIPNANMDKIDNFIKQAYDRGTNAYDSVQDLRAEFEAFKNSFLNGFDANFFSDGLSTLDALVVTNGYYNQNLTRLEV